MTRQQQGRRPARGADEAAQSADDTAARCLTREERMRLSMDSWEPSLLRNLLNASGRLVNKRQR